MSGKKSFKSNNPALAFLSSAPVEAEAQHEQTAHIEHDAQEEQEPISKQTQGKKGKKLPRINMAFSPENLEHIQLMGRLYGVSATEYVNRLIAADRVNSADMAAQARKLFEEAENK